MNIPEMIREKRKDILKLADQHGTSNIRIFGSVARNESKEDSDLDLLVNMGPGRTLFDHAALIQDLQNMLGCKVDVALESGLKDRVRARVLREAIPL